MASTLEQRIAAAINREVKASNAIADLLQEVTTAIGLADIALAELKQLALDPGTVINNEVPDKLRIAELRASRLHAAQGPLQDCLAAALAAEKQVRWEVEAKDAELKRDLAAKRMAKLPELMAEILEIAAVVEAADEAITRVNIASAPGQRHLKSVELVARNIERLDAGGPILRKVVLPDWQDSTKVLWPKPQTSLMASLVAPAFDRDISVTDEWWRPQAERSIAEQKAAKAAKAKKIEDRQQFYKSY
jgi:hypothetical protein